MSFFDMLKQEEEINPVFTGVDKIFQDLEIKTRRKDKLTAAKINKDEIAKRKREIARVTGRRNANWYLTKTTKDPIIEMIKIFGDIKVRPTTATPVVKAAEASKRDPILDNSYDFGKSGKSPSGSPQPPADTIGNIFDI